MTKQARSDDYIDGLQTAYKILYAYHERARLPDYKCAYQAAMAAINEAIDSASVDKPRILLS